MQFRSYREYSKNRRPLRRGAGWWRRCEPKRRRTRYSSDPLEGPELDRLEAAFAGNRAALSIVEEMRRSNHIYRPFLGRGGSGYLANLERETLMKRNFLRSFEEAERRNGKPPKVFLKFGGSHAMRGMTSTDVPGLANFLAEWGQAKGHRLVNVMIDCIGGEAMNPQTNIAGPCENYFGPTTLIGRAVANGPTVQIVDLRALRPLLGKLQSADPEFAQNHSCVRLVCGGP